MPNIPWFLLLKPEVYHFYTIFLSYFSFLTDAKYVWVKQHWSDINKTCPLLLFLSGSQHPGRDGDGRDGPRNQHEWNHHTGGCPEQDGEVWGKPDHAGPLYVWLPPFSLRYRYSMQACVYAAPCMLFSGDLADAPYLLLSVCALFWPLLLLLHCSQHRTKLNIFSPVKDSIIVITSVITLQT